MIRAVVLYESEPEPERYAKHVEELASKVPGATIRHGKSLGAPFGEPAFAHYFEFEWADREGFKAGTRSEEFAASGKDAMDMGIPFSVTFLELD
jgi:hypothetical protein